MEAMSIEQRLERLERLNGVTGPAICPDPTGEGSAWQGSAIGFRIPTGWIGCSSDSWTTHERNFNGLRIAPDPSIPWGEGYEAILPEEHRCGDEFRETRGWMVWTNKEGLSMLNASSFPWRRRKSPAEPAPGSDAEHPPVGYRLAKAGEERRKGYVFWHHKRNGGWRDGNEDCVGDEIEENDIIANPIPANEGDSQKAESLCAGCHRKECAQDSRTHGGTVKICANRIPSDSEKIETLIIAKNRMEAVATMSPACLRCQSSHCCSVRDDSAKIPLCVSDPEGSLPLWMPWTNADVQARVDPIYAQVDALREEIAQLREKVAAAEEFAENMRKNRDEVLRTSQQDARDAARLRLVVQSVYAAIANEVRR